MKDLDDAVPTESPVQPLVERLRDTPNWMRECYCSWKDGTLKYDRAPFEAADEIERLRGEVGILQERRCEICGYAEHHREHTGCLRTQLAAAQAVIKTALSELRRSSYHPWKDQVFAVLENADSTALHDRLRQEREWCAKVCDKIAQDVTYQRGSLRQARLCAERIRNMGDE